MGALDSVKKIYFSLEDKYYEVLDAVQKKIPVYSIVDPIDKIVPSFGVLLAALFLVVGSGLFFIAGGISFAPENVTLSLSFNHEDGAPAEGVLISVNLAPEFASPSPDLVFPLSKTTSAQGKVAFSLPPGTYVVLVEDAAFESFSQVVDLKESSSKIFSLKASTPQSASRSLLIQDSSGSILGIISPVEILLSFSCQSGAPPLSQKVYSGNVSIQQPASCSGMSVTVSVNGFITKTQVILGDTTVINMQSSAALGPDAGVNPSPTTGTVEVYTKSGSNVGVSGVQVKLYKVPPAGSNILADQSLSDSSGFSLFENALPGKYVVVASKQGYKQTTSVEFSVIAGETNTINLSLPVSSNKKKLFVKVLKQSDQTILPGSTVTLFVQSVGGKYLEYDSYTVDGNGLVNKELADFNGTTQLVVQRSNFITQILPNAGIFSNDEVNALPILLESTASASANGSISNGVVADVKVVDEINFPVYDAQTHLYYPDINGVLIASKKTNAQGIARYTDLPEGSYQASASTKDFDGSSAKVEGMNGKIITLQVPLQVGSALVEVTVKTEQNQIIADANVSIVKLSNDAVQAKASTNAQGVAQMGVLSDQTVYVRVEKPGYLPFSSVPFDILKDNTHKILIEVSLTSATPSVDMALTSIYQISSSGSTSLAQSIAAGNTYAFHFSLKTPVNQDGLMGVVRLNGTTPSLLSTDVGQVVGAQVSKGSSSFYTTFTPSNEFAPKNPVDSGVAAKIALNSAGDVNGGAYEFIVLVKVNSLAVPNVDKLRINYQSKSDSQTSALYESVFTVGQALPPQGDFLYLLYLTQEGSSDKIQVSSAKPAFLEQNKNYSLEYVITNVAGQDYAAATASFAASGSLTVTPSVVSLAGFSNNKSAGGSVTLKSTQTCSSAQSYCSSILVQLSGVGTGKQPTTYNVQFFTVPEKQVTLNVSPSFLIPNQANQVVQAVGLDNFNVPLTSAQGLQMVGQLLDSSGTDIGGVIPFTEIQNGAFIASIPSATEGSDLEITASASGYLSTIKTIPVSTSSVINLSEDFSCISVTPQSNPFVLVQNAEGTITIDTVDCGEEVEIYTTGFNADIVVPITNGGSSVNEGNPITLDEDDSVSLKAKAPPVIGLYPIYVYAKFASQSQESLIEVLDLEVNPVQPSQQCLDLSSYSFDLTQNGSASSVMVNNCNPLVQDAFYPSAQLGVNEVYTHAIPPILTPQLQSPGAEVSFEWQVQVDYNFTSNADLNITDFALTSLSDANWTRYMIKDGTTFLDTKDSFAGAESVMKIPDSKQIGGNAQLENNDSSDFPHLPANPKEPKSLLFETILMVRSEVNLDAICLDAEGINGFKVFLDGKLVQDKADADCTASSIPAALKNVKLAPGPHSLQIFVQDKANSPYKIWASYRDSVLTKGDWKSFSYKANTTGLHTNAELGLTVSSNGESGIHTNGLFAYPVDPAIGYIAPIDHHLVPKYMGTLAGPVADILSNAGGAEHLKVAYPRFYSSNPQVRIFLKDLDVYAQFIGYDDPVSDSQKQQFVVVENKDLVGTAYGIMRLEDYTTFSPSNKELDVGVLVDVSSSVLAKEPSLLFGSGSNAVGKQNGLCDILKNMESGLGYYSSAKVSFKVFWLNTPSEYKNLSLASPCAGVGLDIQTLAVSNPPGFDVALDSNVEFWARGAEVLASNAFWKNDTAHLMVVVTDSKPLGNGPASLGGVWGDSEQEEAVDKAISALKSKAIRSAVLYVTPIESTSTDQFDSQKNDAIEMMEKFSSETSLDVSGDAGLGFVEALEFSPYMSVALNNNPLAWEQSGNNKMVQRLAQHAFRVGYQDVVVKLISHPENACIGENGEVGFTGPDALPKVQYNWEWNEVDLDMCDRKDGSPSDYLYCDGFQFMISLTKRLQALREAYDSSATNPNNELVAQIPELTQFDAYLIRDNFNQSMRDDFVNYETNSSFADAPDYFKSSLAGGAWKDYFDSPQNLIIGIDGNESQTLLPSSGLYRVSIDFTTSTIPKSFFSGSEPSANIVVSLDLLSPASSLGGYSDFYEIPLDGLLGLDEQSLTYARDGYGTAFTGNGGALLAQTQSSYSIKTYPNAPGLTALNTFHVNASPDFVGLNARPDRGVALEIDRLAKTFTFNPSVPTPLLAEWSSDSFGNGDLYYGIQSSASGQFLAHNTATNPLSKWKPLASKQKQTSLGCTDPSACAICLDAGSQPFLSSLVYDANPVTGQSCSLSPAFAADKTKAFGFHSAGGQENKSYLGTILYSDVQSGVIQNYSIWLACSSSSTFPPGKVSVGNQLLDQGGESTALAINGNSPLQQTFDSARVMANMVGLIGEPSQPGTEQGWSCLSYSGNKTRVYWNADQLYAYATQYASSFTDFSGNACTSAGTPFSSNGTFTLSYQNDTSLGTLTQAQANGLCGLWNEKPAFNYYGQSGIPYPAGTQRFLTSGSISTSDSVSSLVQYREDPLNCPAGAGTLKATCGVNTTFQSPVCGTNDVWVWSNI